jgi:hypothetical protein
MRSTETHRWGVCGGALKRSSAGSGAEPQKNLGFSIFSNIGHAKIISFSTIIEVSHLRIL